MDHDEKLDAHGITKPLYESDIVLEYSISET